MRGAGSVCWKVLGTESFVATSVKGPGIIALLVFWTSGPACVVDSALSSRWPVLCREVAVTSVIPGLVCEGLFFGCKYQNNTAKITSTGRSTFRNKLHRTGDACDNERSSFFSLLPGMFTAKVELHTASSTSGRTLCMCEPTLWTWRKEALNNSSRSFSEKGLFSIFFFV